jgi:ribose transport system ATP-binding protein
VTESNALTANRVSKRYGQTLALDDVTLALVPGQVHAVVGHNGAGKSTLLRLLAGAERPDAGGLEIGGRPVSFGAPTDAFAAGVAAVYQELSLIDELSVAQSVFLGRERVRGGRLDKAGMAATTRALCLEYGLDVEPGVKVRELSVGQRQMVEIVAALHRDARYLLLDEPTSALESDRIDHLLATIRKLARDQGLAILLVDHKLDEVFAVADRITALASGRVVLAGEAATISRAEVVHAIVGESHSVADLAVVAAPTDPADRAEPPSDRGARSSIPPSAAAAAGTPVLAVDRLATERLRGVTLAAHAGRVLGVYGLVGSGRSRFLRAVVGLERPVAGTMALDGRPYRPRDPLAAIRRRVAYLSEERKADGFVPLMTPGANATLPVLDRFARLGVLNQRRRAATALEALGRVRVRGRLDGPIADLSGGNQQKTLFARALLENPRLLLLDQPTKGVDIGAKAEIHRIVRDLAASGEVAVVVVSDEEEEILGLADEVVVFRAGRCDGTTYLSDALDVRTLRELAWSGADVPAAAPAAPTV